MSMLLRILGGSIGPYLFGGAAILAALSIGTATVNGLRLDHAKADLTEARAALINPVTHKTWRSEAERDGPIATQCTATLSAQNAAVAARSAEDARKLHAAEKAVGDARAVAESYRRTAPEVRAYVPKGSDACERVADVDAMIRKDLAR